ncbi:hypothetical protein WAK64_03075 [Bacillus spongiae]|uniref:Uncharacterized protein n=1 Tax=Bacillus spongiae TaxID=2683610 RepID=A0ABU8H9W5_9BACI
MIWIFVFLLTVLWIGYIWPSAKKPIQQTNVPYSFLLMSILSTLSIHGFLALLEEDEIEGATIDSLEELLVNRKNIFSQEEWHDIVLDHCSNNASLDDFDGFDLCM